MLEAARAYWSALDADAKAAFRFHHISTDEVYGDLHTADDFFTETTPYAPSSPYSASKASSDHLVRARLRTYGLPTLVTNCSNNYGPYHFPEKLIPLMILNALAGKPLPVYGNGQQIRDWLYVEDHARALYHVVTNGAVGETYNIGGHNERKNLDVVRTICALLEELAPQNRRVWRIITISLPSSTIDPAMTYVMPSTRRKSPASWAGRRRKPSKAGCEKPFSGISPMRLVETRAGWQLSGRTLRAETLNGRFLLGGETNERHHSGGRFRYPVASHYARRIKAASARLRQTDDLLSVIGANAGGHS